MRKSRPNECITPVVISSVGKSESRNDIAGPGRTLRRSGSRVGPAEEAAGDLGATRRVTPDGTVRDMPIIATQALTKRFPRVTALDGLTLAVEPGIVGLVGANGAGKSTLIKILLGLLEPTAGQASVLGKDVASRGAEIRSLVGYMPEHECLPPDLSA